MLLISYIDGSALDTRQEEVVAKSDLGGTRYYVLAGEERDTLKAVPEEFVLSRIYPRGIEDPPRPEVYVEEHPEVSKLDWSLVERLHESN